MEQHIADQSQPTTFFFFGVTAMTGTKPRTRSGHKRLVNSYTPPETVVENQEPAPVAAPVLAPEPAPVAAPEPAPEAAPPATSEKPEPSLSERPIYRLSGVWLQRSKTTGKTFLPFEMQGTSYFVFKSDFGQKANEYNIQRKTAEGKYQFCTDAVKCDTYGFEAIAFKMDQHPGHVFLLREARERRNDRSPTHELFHMPMADDTPPLPVDEPTAAADIPF